MNDAFHKLLDRILPPEDDPYLQDFEHSGADAQNPDTYPEDESRKEPRHFTPQNTKELMEVLRRTPRDVLSDRERAIIANVMTFSDRHVADIMIPVEDIPFVKEDDFLGPLTLDKLYKSGLSHFPVVDGRGKILGAIHTQSLNSLEIKDASKAKDYLDPYVYYVRDDYTLEQALAVFLRANCFFVMVVNHTSQTVGMLTYKDLIIHIFGEPPEDNFTGDADPFAVSHRA